jgi:hypothetical protein
LDVAREHGLEARNVYQFLGTFLHKSQVACVNTRVQVIAGHPGATACLPHTAYIGVKAFTTDQTGKNLPANFGWQPTKSTIDLVVSEDFSPSTQHCAEQGFHIFDSITEPDPFDARDR